MVKAVSVVIMVVLMMAAAVPGVFAVWRYSLLVPDDADQSMGSEISIFEYPPEEIVPDDEEASQLGQNHWDLIQKILWEASYGLNATKEPIIHNRLNQVGDVLYCSETVQGGNLKHLMIDSLSSASALYFVIEYVSDTEYNTYTFLNYDMISNSIGTEIEVYKTIMRKDGKEWGAPTSFFGYAKVNDPDIKGVSRGIDVTSWRYALKPQ